MSKIWYDFLVEREEITLVLDKFSLDSEEKAELIDLIDQTLHHHTLNVILSHLPQSYHQDFISRFHKNPADGKLLSFVKTKVTVDIEVEIRKQAQRIKKEILSDIKKSHLKTR
jgi:hypothetical protein